MEDENEQETKHPSGRPTKYKEEFCEQLIAFFDQEPYEDLKIPHYTKDNVLTWTDVRRVARKLPTLRDFAKSIGVGMRTIQQWADPDYSGYQKEWAEAVEDAKDIRKDFLIQNGLQGLYPPAAFIYIATNLTDMKNRQEVGHEGEVSLVVVDYKKAEATGFNPDGSKRISTPV